MSVCERKTMGQSIKTSKLKGTRQKQQNSWGWIEQNQKEFTSQKYIIKFNPSIFVKLKNGYILNYQRMYQKLGEGQKRDNMIYVVCILKELHNPKLFVFINYFKMNNMLQYYRLNIFHIRQKIFKWSRII